MSVVKVKLRESFECVLGGCEPIEFEVDFAGLSKDNIDAIVSWRDLDM